MKIISKALYSNERTLECIKVGVLLQEKYTELYNKVMKINHSNRWYNLNMLCNRIYDKWNSIPEEEMESFTSKGYMYEFMIDETKIVESIINDFINEITIIEE